MFGFGAFALIKAFDPSIYAAYIYVQLPLLLFVVYLFAINKLLLFTNGSWFLSSCTRRNNNLWNAESDKLDCRYIYIYIGVFRRAKAHTWSAWKWNSTWTRILWQNSGNFNKSQSARYNIFDRTRERETVASDEARREIESLRNWERIFVC